MLTICSKSFSQSTVVTDGGSDATTNYVTKWKNGGTYKIMKSLIYDDGTYIGINTTSPAAGIHLVGNSLNQSSQILERQESSAYGANFAFRSRKSTWGAVGSGIYIGSIAFQGPKTSSNTYGTGALIQAITTETWTDAANGTKLAFMTTSNGSSSYSTRMTIDQNGYVGIGITSPGALLHLNGSSGTTLKIVDGNQGSNKILTSDANGVASWSTPVTGLAWSLTGNSGTSAGTNFIGTTDAVDWIIKTNNAERIRVLSGGNVGIGLNNPSEKLQVNGSISWGTGSYISTLRTDEGASIELRGSGTPYIDFSSGVQDYDVRLIRSGADELMMDGGDFKINSGNIILNTIGKKLIYDSADLFTYNTNSVGQQSLGWYDDSWNTGGKTMYLSGWAGLKFFTNGTPRLFIDNGGNVGIGITPNTSVKLTVDGKIECEEVEVKNIGADYVFEEGYKLMTIYDVETYIKQNKHLPGVPSACETEKGIGLGQMNEILLQKVEELTIYIIQLNNECNYLKSELKKINNK